MITGTHKRKTLFCLIFATDQVRPLTCLGCVLRVGAFTLSPSHVQLPVMKV